MTTKKDKDNPIIVTLSVIRDVGRMAGCVLILKACAGRLVKLTDAIRRRKDDK